MAQSVCFRFLAVGLWLVAIGGAQEKPRGVEETQLQQVKAELAGLEAKAKNGDLAAAHELANRLINLRKPKLALAFYRQAAEGGVLAAQERLGLLLLNSSERAAWAEGHSWLDKAAQRGSVRALEEQARIILFGSHGREKSVAKAEVILKRASKMPGAKESHFLLGKMAAEGIGRERDGAQAVAHLRKGEAAGSIDAILGLVELYAGGGLVEKDVAEAQRLAKKAYSLGSAEGAYRTALFLEPKGEGGERWMECRGWLANAANKGHVGALARLGTYALQGLGEEKNPGRAYEFYRQAAGRGHADSAYAIANMYVQGLGVPNDPVAATGWFRVAAERGQAQAQNEFGVRLAAGSGVPSDLQEAASWFQRACRQNLPAAFVNLGELYLAGNGVGKDEGRGYQLLESAAKVGHAGAQWRLASLCEQGIGLGGKADPVGAAYWAARAARADARYAEGAAKLRDALQDVQLGELQRRLAAVDGKE